MSHTHTVRQAARRLARFLHCTVRVRWQRFQSRIAAAYYQRVTVPVQLWVAAGCPPAWRPQLPLWQPLAWRWLTLTGWPPHRPRPAQRL